MTQIDIAALVAEAVLNAAGTGLKNYTLNGSRDRIIEAARTALIAQDTEIERRRLSVSAQEDRIDGLTILLAEALPWVEAQLDDPAYKPGTVRAVANRIRAALGEKP